MSLSLPRALAVSHTAPCPLTAPASAVDDPLPTCVRAGVPSWRPPSTSGPASRPQPLRAPSTSAASVLPARLLRLRHCFPHRGSRTVPPSQPTIASARCPLHPIIAPPPQPVATTACGPRVHFEHPRLASAASASARPAPDGHRHVADGPSLPPLPNPLPCLVSPTALAYWAELYVVCPNQLQSSCQHAPRAAYAVSTRPIAINLEAAGANLPMCT